MANFVIIPTEPNNNLNAALTKRFGNHAYLLPNGEWFVSYDGTSKQLCDEIGISDGAVG